MRKATIGIFTLFLVLATPAVASAPFLSKHDAETAAGRVANALGTLAARNGMGGLGIAGVESCERQSRQSFMCTIVMDFVQLDGSDIQCTEDTRISRVSNRKLRITLYPNTADCQGDPGLVLNLR